MPEERGVGEREADRTRLARCTYRMTRSDDE